MNAGPGGRAAADRAPSDTTPLLPTATTPGRPDIVSAREIAEFLGHLARLRSPALGADPAEHAALLARKTELLDRIAAQHTRTADPPPTTPTTPERRTP